MLDIIRRELERYEGQWVLPDDLDALLEIIGGAIGGGQSTEQASHARIDVVAENIAEAIKVPGYSMDASPHWPECWRYTSHHACAVAEVERLRAALEEIYDLGRKDSDWDVVETLAREALEAARRDETL